MLFNKAFTAGAVAGYLLTDLIRPNRNVKSGSIQVAYNIKPSSKDCYDRIKEILISRDIEMKIKEVAIFEGKFGRGKRTYLRVKRDRFTYYLCAAPFGNTYFFSYWLKESLGFFARFVRWIPLFGPPIFWYLTRLSYYDADSLAVFNYVVRDALNQTAKEMTESHGVRIASQQNEPILRTFPEQPLA